jgi:hypothetical protein
MSPYRQVSQVAHRTQTVHRYHPEELVAYGLLLSIGAIPFTVALLDRTCFGAEGTIGGLMMALGALGFLRSSRP